MGKGDQERFSIWNKVPVRGLLGRVRPLSPKRQNLGVGPHPAVNSTPYTRTLSEPTSSTGNRTGSAPTGYKNMYKLTPSIFSSFLAALGHIPWGPNEIADAT